MKSNRKSVTSANYSTLDEAYKFFNKKLFSNELPDVMIVLQRKGKRNLGYFHPERFFSRDKKIKVKVSELALNPDQWHWLTDTNILSVLVHEMAHVWQFHCTDKYPRNGYHDKKWGAKMKEIGLYPSNTGAEGGKETGQQMDHYIIQNGKYEKSALAFLKNRKLEWNSALIAKAQSGKRNKTKFTCPDCEQNAWAKPDANLICGECEMHMEAS